LEITKIIQNSIPLEMDQKCLFLCQLPIFVGSGVLAASEIEQTSWRIEGQVFNLDV
jgi:hypothetical protein